MADNEPVSSIALGEPLALRQATKQDLDGIMWIVEHAYPDDTPCDYRFPYRHDSPEQMADYLAWQRQHWSSYLNQPDKYVFLLVTAPISSHDGSSGSTAKPVALAIWDVAIETESTGGDHHLHDRTFVNVKHVQAFKAAVMRAFVSFRQKHQSRQLHLAWLMTHPAFRRRGAGTMLCDWGLKEAAKRGNWPLTVMASPMGSALYQNLGYSLMGKETAQVDGEDEHLDIDILDKLL